MEDFIDISQNIKGLVIFFKSPTDSVRHGLLLEIHVLVVGVEPRSFVREEFRAQAEEEAVVGAVELRAELPRARGEAPEFMAGLRENGKCQVRSAICLLYFLSKK